MLDLRKRAGIAVIVMTDGSNVGSTLKDGDPIVEAQRQYCNPWPSFKQLQLLKAR